MEKRNIKQSKKSIKEQSKKTTKNKTNRKKSIKVNSSELDNQLPIPDALVPVNPITSVPKKTVQIESRKGTIVTLPTDAEVNIIKELDEIFDLLDDFPPGTKQYLLQIMDEHKKTDFDKAVFLKTFNKTEDESYYFVITKIVTLEEDKGLVLLYSNNVDLLCIYLESHTTIEYERSKLLFEQTDGDEGTKSFKR